MEAMQGKMAMEEERAKMERAADELERRSRYLSDLIQQQRRSRGDGRVGEGKERMAAGQEVVVVVKEQGPPEEKQRKRIVDGGRAGSVDPKEQQHPSNIRVRAADMPLELQRRAFRCARQVLGTMPKLDSKRLALTLKKVMPFGPTLLLCLPLPASSHDQPCPCFQLTRFLSNLEERRSLGAGLCS